VVGKDTSLFDGDFEFVERERRDNRYWDIDAEGNGARGDEFKFVGAYPIGM